MKLPAFIPTPDLIAREAIIVICGALLAAAIMGQLPSVKNYVKNAWA